MAVYLAHTTADPATVMADGLADDCIELTAGLLLVDTSLARSRLYHRLKAIQQTSDPLLVAELTEPPKFKGMAPGALAWLRARFA
ncbi:hypothetical protein ACE2AJ_09585 [Aquihabitans daechungensis]|uniref:hypothetical protein n=1 Tax=Aquihabitans daechungensis TaxID=1052257 RepID=UPI003BA06D5F